MQKTPWHPVSWSTESDWDTSAEPTSAKCGSDHVSCVFTAQTSWNQPEHIADSSDDKFGLQQVFWWTLSLWIWGWHCVLVRTGSLWKQLRRQELFSFKQSSCDAQMIIWLSAVFHSDAVNSNQLWFANFQKHFLCFCCRPDFLKPPGRTENERLRCICRNLTGIKELDFLLWVCLNQSGYAKINEWKMICPAGRSDACICQCLNCRTTLRKIYLSFLLFSTVEV